MQISGARWILPKNENYDTPCRVMARGDFPHNQQNKSSTHFLKRWEERVVE